MADATVSKEEYDGFVQRVSAHLGADLRSDEEKQAALDAEAEAAEQLEKDQKKAELTAGVEQDVDETAPKAKQAQNK